jgi:hypothetical protein
MPNHSFFQELKSMVDALPAWGRVLDKSSVSKFSIREIFSLERSSTETMREG